MSVTDKIKILQDQKVDDNIFEEILKEYKNMISSGVTKPRGYCLSSIADYTTYTNYSDNVFQNVNK